MFASCWRADGPPASGLMDASISWSPRLITTGGEGEQGAPAAPATDPDWFKDHDASQAEEGTSDDVPF
jgi:hypothetical protein